MIKIDGSYLEGGGQIARTSLALSTITGKSFEITDIRKNRPNPGLKTQHLFCVRSLKELCDAKTNDIKLGSSTLRYIPGKIKPKTISVDIGTAGSITLLLQSLLLPCCFAEKNIRLKITGGTDTKWSMPFDFFKQVFTPHLKKYADIEIKMLKRGYYPKGGGKIDIKIKPKQKPDKIDLTEQKQLIQIKGISHASKDLEKAEVAERQAKAAKLYLNKLKTPVDISSEYCDTLSTGSGITLWAIFENNIILGADSLGERGKKAEIVGKEAAEKLITEIDSGAAVDQHLADNLIPLLGLSGGSIKTSKITDHTKTNIYTVEKFLNTKFTIKENTISCKTS